LNSHLNFPQDAIIYDKLVSVIIINYNGKDVLEKCVESVYSSTYSLIEIIIVDNSSNDCVAEDVSKKFKVILLKNKKNIGYSAANNLGLLAARGEYILILNNDTVLNSRAIEELVAESIRSPSQILQPKILLMDQPKIINSTGLQTHLSGFGLLRGCGEEESGQYDTSTFISAPHGACFFAERKTIKEVGLFDERFFAFCEDTDFGWRAMLLGKKIKFVPSALVFHKWGHSFDKNHLSNKIQLAERNRLIMVLTNYEYSTLVLLIPTLLLAETSTLFYCTIRGVLPSKFKGYAELLQMRNYLLQRRGWIQSHRKISDDSLLALFACEFDHIQFGVANKPLNMLFRVLTSMVLRRF
jgi:GT2 family glycosyltransferase